MERTFQTPGRLALDIRIPSGSIVIETAETAVTELTLEPLDELARESMDTARIEFRDARGGHELRVQTSERRGFFFGRSPEFTLRVLCPHGTTVEARTRSADLEVRGSLGALEARTASGDMEVEQVEGPATIQTASGDVQLELATGPVEVSTASGDVKLGRIGGEAKVNLVSGDVTIREAQGRIEAHTVSGDHRHEAMGVGSLSAHSVSGDILVRVRRGASVWMDVRSVSGDTHSELETGDGPPADESTLVELRLDSVSGDILIERAATASVDQE